MHLCISFLLQKGRARILSYVKNHQIYKDDIQSPCWIEEDGRPTHSHTPHTTPHTPLTTYHNHNHTPHTIHPHHPIPYHSLSELTNSDFQVRTADSLRESPIKQQIPAKGIYNT